MTTRPLSSQQALVDSPSCGTSIDDDSKPYIRFLESFKDDLDHRRLCDNHRICTGNPLTLQRFWTASQLVGESAGRLS